MRRERGKWKQLSKQEDGSEEEMESDETEGNGKGENKGERSTHYEFQPIIGAADNRAIVFHLFPVLVVFQILDLLLSASACALEQLHLELLSLLSRHHDASNNNQQPLTGQDYFDIC